MGDLKAGLTADAVLIVAPEDTALALGSGDVLVLGTPRLVALCEEAAVSAIAGRLDAGDTSVGAHVEIDHLRATPVGGAVTATAVLEEIAGPKLYFALSAEDAGGRIAAGRMVRVIVDRERFVERAAG